MDKKIAIVFPGQGAQRVGMLDDIAAQFPEVKEYFSQASNVLGYDLWALSQKGPEQELDKTFHTQPALLAGSYSIWQILKKRKKFKPYALAGHSLGEYSALVCANSLSFTDAIRLVSLRGHFMQDAVEPGKGAMAAIMGLDESSVATICQKAISNPEEVVAIANYNSIGQIVIAGHKGPVEKAMVLAKEQGAKLVVIIPVSVPSHCILMHPAAERLAEELKNITFKKPEIPILNNVDVQYYKDSESIQDSLTRQLYMPVRWVETVQILANEGVTEFIECGPGKVLTGLNKRINKHLQLLNTFDLASLTRLLEEDENQQKTG